jgi:hypothetical protein
VAAAEGDQPYSGVGVKRTAACVAVYKIKNQADVLNQQVRMPASKKKKGAGGGAGGEGGSGGAAE